MKTTRVNLPNNVKDIQTIDNYLTDIYNKKGLFSNLQKLYEESRKAENSQEYMTNPAIKEAIVEMQPDGTWSFFLYLAIGQKEAAYYLAASFINELGTTQNDDLAALTMAIGVKLGDKKSIELVGNDPIPDEVNKLADQCVVQIRKNAKEIGSKAISYEEAIGRAKAVDKIVKSNAKLSFEDNILPGSIKIYANFVSLVDDNISSPKIDQKKHFLKLLPVVSKALLLDKTKTHSATSQLPQCRGKEMVKHSGRS
ncbi:hypothetical protein [Candidatus Tisiphia endosymbiont of Oplodontha viridula]|uniref:hypothetical protein n=1 Tax=Candidatus Tisiphia endosymbiont of Oplodontha viridula TaxID=3077925 RepID=UPI0035C919E2